MLSIDLSISIYLSRNLCQCVEPSQPNCLHIWLDLVVKNYTVVRFEELEKSQLAENRELKRRLSDLEQKLFSADEEREKILQLLEDERSKRNRSASTSLADVLEQVRGMVDLVAPEHKRRRTSSGASDIAFRGRKGSVGSKSHASSSGVGSLNKTSSIPEIPEQEEASSTNTEGNLLSKEQLTKILWSFEDLLLSLSDAGGSLFQES